MAVAGRLVYPLDLSPNEWALVEPLLPPAGSAGRRQPSRREIVDAALYLVRTGCA